MNLLNISEGASLALHSLTLMVKSQPDRLSVKYLAVELQASQNHLAKVFQKLSKAGMVASVRGPSGGFVLKKPADQISFLDVLETLEGPIERDFCPLGKKHCAFEVCIFNNNVNRINSELYESYRSIKLSDFS